MARLLKMSGCKTQDAGKKAGAINAVGGVGALRAVSTRRLAAAWRVKTDPGSVPVGFFPARGLVMLAALAALYGSAAFAAIPVDLSARVSPTTITVGDPVRYEITVTHPAGARVVLPAILGNTGSLEVLAHAVRSDSAAENRVTLTHVLTLAAYEVGVDTLPPQRVEVRSGPDTTAQVLYTPPTVLTVEATAPDVRDLADIHDGDRLPRAFPWWIPLAILFLGGAVWAIRAWRARRAARAAQRSASPPPVPDAAEAALARLDALERDLMPTSGPARLFAFALSEILREYLARRYGIDALEATTPELLDRVEGTDLTHAEREWLRAAAEELDGVKFADLTLTGDAAPRLVRDARTLVRDSWSRREARTDHPGSPEGTRA